MFSGEWRPLEDNSQDLWEDQQERSVARKGENQQRIVRNEVGGPGWIAQLVRASF